MPIPRPITEHFAALEAARRVEREFPTISQASVAKLYRDCLTHPAVFMTGSVALGVQTADSDVDFMVDPAYWVELELPETEHCCGSGEESWSTAPYKYKQEDDSKPIINIIVARDADTFEEWKYATDMSKHIAKVDYDILRNKDRRVEIFRSFCSVKHSEIYYRPERVAQREEEARRNRARMEERMEARLQQVQFASNYTAPINIRGDRVHIRRPPTWRWTYG